MLGCPIADDIDRLSLELLCRLVLPGRAQLELVSHDATASDVLEIVQKGLPAVVCLTNVPPASSARARYLCKRLRAAQPNLPIVVALTGTPDNANAISLRDQLLSAGANQVTTTYAQAREQLVPLLQVAAHREMA